MAYILCYNVLLREGKNLKTMSAWAYRECEKCGKIVHINHTCKRWNNHECDGDPWNEKQKVNDEIKQLKEQRARHASEIVNIDKRLEHLDNAL